MEKDIQEAVKRMHPKLSAVRWLCDVAKRTLEETTKMQFELFEFFDKMECNTGFAVSLRLHSEQWILVMEFSKIGPFSKRYWFKKTFFGKEYADDVPSDRWKQKEVEIETLIERIGTRLLRRDELEEPLPTKMRYPTPLGNAETVDDLLFFFDGRVL